MLRLYFYQPRKSGSILVICLWTLVILSILGMGLSSFVLQEIRFASTYERMSFSLPAARAAIKTVFYERQNDPTGAYDTLQELTRENKAVLCGNASYEYYFADKENSSPGAGIIDEGALINLNTASMDVLKRLPGITDDLADKIVNAGFRPYSSINEVFLIEGMNKDNFKLFKDLITVYGSGKININTANKSVLMAIGLDEELVDIILRFRKEHKIASAREDSSAKAKEPEYGFSSLAAILDDLRSFSMLSLRQEQDLLSALSVLDVKSEYLRFNVIPKAGNKQGIHYSITIHPATKKILSWREY